MAIGKDFHVLNLQQETTSEHDRRTRLLANLLSFYEQQLVFANRSAEFRPYAFGAATVVVCREQRQHAP